MTSEEIIHHANAIISSSRTRDKYVFLCEGEISDVVTNARYNPSALGRLERLQDSSFYKSCLNRNIKSFKLPFFVNCGGKSDVINVYNKIFEIVSLKNENGEKSYINLEQLYAIVDLDFQKAVVNANTTIEDIYHNLYLNTNIMVDNILSNKILVTGLIHKEAYFLLPKFHDILLDKKLELIYNDNDINMENIFHDMCEEISSDKDLLSNLDTALSRFKCSNLNTLDDLKTFCLNEIATNNNYKFLLTIRKAKSYWEKITSNYMCDSEKLREQLSLAIGEKISIDEDIDCHITALFNTIIK